MSIIGLKRVYIIKRASTQERRVHVIDVLEVPVWQSSLFLHLFSLFPKVTLLSFPLPSFTTHLYQNNSTLFDINSIFHSIFAFLTFAVGSALDTAVEAFAVFFEAV